MGYRVTIERRSGIPRRVRHGGAGPTKAVQLLLGGLGYPLRLHQDKLPGRPDVVLSQLQTA